ncbi:hypothetical protein L6452_22207 [Arctium lappa]|uniref:Uncharacterized protein n=1 Tax=Arctium lappa TaxID=4217 RepID=A0ACB9AYS0_ARCLA|nr:hypothetical protein L6452_22207 [Arctium lappa]
MEKKKKEPPPSKKVAKEQPPPAKRITKSSSRFKTKPLTEEEGSAIALSEDSRERSSKEVTSGAVVSKLSTTALDALAAIIGAQVQTSEASHVQNAMIIPTEATSVAVNPFPIEAIQTTPTNTTITTTLETPPEIQESLIAKPTKNPSVDAPIIPETTIPTPIATPILTPLNTPAITLVATPKAYKTPPLVSPSKIPYDTLSELLGIDLTPLPKNQDQHYVNPTPPIQHKLIDEPSEETLKPSPKASQNTKPLGTPVNNPYLNMAIDSSVDEAPPQFSPRMVEHSPSMSLISPVHTATTPPTTGNAQGDDEDVDMTIVKRRTMHKKKPTAKKKKRLAKKVEIVEDVVVEDISPPKRITRQGAQAMTQAEGSRKAILQ